jgi:phage shock protein A
MANMVGRLRRSLAARLGWGTVEQADPRVRLEEAIAEDREQHRLLVEQAANVVASQAQLQGRIDRAIDEVGRVSAAARQALALADQARLAGDEEQAAAMEQAARSLAGRLVVLDRETDTLRRLLLDATDAANRARQAVATSSTLLRKRLAQREALLSHLEQAELHEQLNATLRQLSTSPGGEAPTLAEVGETIDRRLAEARAMTEVIGSAVELQMLEVEQAQRDAETQAKLGALRDQPRVSVSAITPRALAAPEAIDPSATALPDGRSGSGRPDPAASSACEPGGPVPTR